MAAKVKIVVHLELAMKVDLFDEKLTLCQKRKQKGTFCPRRRLSIGTKWLCFND